MTEVWHALAGDVARAFRELLRSTSSLLLALVVVGWCRSSRSHYIEPWVGQGFVGNHSGCVSCTWCIDCRELIGRFAADGHDGDEEVLP